MYFVVFFYMVIVKQSPGGNAPKSSDCSPMRVHDINACKCFHWEGLAFSFAATTRYQCVWRSVCLGPQWVQDKYMLKFEMFPTYISFMIARFMAVSSFQCYTRILPARQTPWAGYAKQRLDCNSTWVRHKKWRWPLAGLERNGRRLKLGQTEKHTKSVCLARTETDNFPINSVLLSHTTVGILLVEKIVCFWIEKQIADYRNITKIPTNFLARMPLSLSLTPPTAHV